MGTTNETKSSYPFILDVFLIDFDFSLASLLACSASVFRVFTNCSGIDFRRHVGLERVGGEGVGKKRKAYFSFHSPSPVTPLLA